MVSEATGNIPFSLVPAPTAQGLAMARVDSDLKVYGDKAYYKLRLLVANGTESTLEEITGRLELLGADGAVISTHPARVAGTVNPPLRPSDRGRFNGTWPATSDVSSARLVVTSTTHRDATEEVVAGSKTELVWDPAPPRGVELQTTIRQRIRREHFGGKWFMRLDLEVRNAGERTLQVLKLDAHYLDKAGKRLGKDETWVVTSSDLPLRPGDVALDSVMEILEERPERVTLHVSRIE